MSRIWEGKEDGNPYPQGECSQRVPTITIKKIPLQLKSDSIRAARVLLF